MLYFCSEPFLVLIIMSYIKIHVLTEDISHKELWLGHLGLIDEIIGLEEADDDSLIAYTEAWEDIRTRIEDLAATTGVSIQVSEEPAKNWNAIWESNFEPVIIPGFVSVRAHFHEPVEGVRYDIRITPKMSFGTGHHATTRLMMAQMRSMDLRDKTVFDYGTGTGILAILAELLGARAVDAIDIDEWSYENALENVAANDSNNIRLAQGDISSVPDDSKYDIILANINRHILLESMQRMNTFLQAQGQLLLSGILKLQDTHIIVEKARNCGFELMSQTEENGWTAILFKKAHSVAPN